MQNVPIIYSKSKQMLHTKLDDCFRPDRSVLVVGASNAGKTTFLLFCAAKTFEIEKNVVLIRDIGDYYEYFTLLKAYPMVAHIPKGCKVDFHHKNLIYEQFDPLNLPNLFDNLIRDKINLLIADRFIRDPEARGFFWSRFFKEILDWKQRPGKGTLQLSLLFDQFNQIAPGRGHYFFSHQEHLVNFIALNMIDYRRSNIRLIASTHTFSMLAPAVRELFSCYIIKRNWSRKNTVVERLQNYSHLFPTIPVNKCIFLDSMGNYDLNIKTPYFLLPERLYNIHHEGNIDKILLDEKNKKKKKGAPWKLRTVLSIIALSEAGFTSEEISKKLHMKQENVKWLKHQYDTGALDEKIKEMEEGEYEEE